MDWKRLGLALGVLLAGLTLISNARAADVRIAVAANFAETARVIAARFERETGHRTSISLGSTGQLFAQIVQGAPYDVFLAADLETPRRAIADRRAVAGTLFTYALGRLVLYTRTSGLALDEGTLRTARYSRLAIANPHTAPYGRAALEVIGRLGVGPLVETRLVQGVSIAQAFQFVETGNAAFGLVALAQVQGHNHGSRWLVPADLHAPIAQGAVLLTSGADNPAARAFLAFLREPAATAEIVRHGYGLEPAASGS